MTQEQFLFWLNGFVELNRGKAPDAEQWASIVEHLGLVFTKVTKPVKDAPKVEKPIDVVKEDAKKDDSPSDVLKKIQDALDKITPPLEPIPFEPWPFPYQKPYQPFPRDTDTGKNPWYPSTIIC